MHLKIRACRIAIAMLAFGLPAASYAQDAATFYKDKTVTLYVGYSGGGGYDIYARVLARHMGKHIPGAPNIVPKNMPGAGSLVLANWLYNVGPKDGTAFLAAAPALIPCSAQPRPSSMPPSSIGSAA
jgi:tripartite-type tricarboxylate transporter receptor subunit TctC